MPDRTSKRQYRILVIDDNPDIHEDFRKVLCRERGSSSGLEAAEAALFGKSETRAEQYEFEVDSAFQGEQGLAKVYHAIQEGRPYAMTFLDVRMPPGWDGIETAPKLWVADPDLQIVICTAYSDYSWETMFLKVGTSERMFALMKPFDRIEVLQLAHNLTDRWEGCQGTRLRQKHLETTLPTRDMIAQRKSEKLHAEIMDLLPDHRKRRE
jgi:DNA-binding NtrC family response regulator